MQMDDGRQSKGPEKQGSLHQSPSPDQRPAPSGVIISRISSGSATPVEMPLAPQNAPIPACDPAEQNLDVLMRPPWEVFTDAIRSWQRSPTHKEGFVRFMGEATGGLIGFCVGAGVPAVVISNVLPPEGMTMLFLGITVVGGSMIGSGTGGLVGRASADRFLGSW